jgi:hypothetical protein
MGVDRAIPELIADIDHVNRLYRQLKDVPQEVCDLFNLLGNSRQFLSLTVTQLTKRELPDESDVVSGEAFRRFRAKLLDLELFVDPTSQLHQSGPKSLVHNVVPWPVEDGDYVREFCREFRARLLQLDSDCQSLLATLLSYVFLIPRYYMMFPDTSSVAQKRRHQHPMRPHDLPCHHPSRPRRTRQTHEFHLQD